MKTRIIDLTGVLYDGDATSVNARTTAGEITVLDHHQPLLTTLAKQSRLRVRSATGEKEFSIPTGFLHLDGNRELTVLVG